MKLWAGRIGLLALLLAASLLSSFAAQTATITASDPVTFLKGMGRVTRPVQPDEVFSVVAVNGDQVTIVDADGYQATLNRSALKITDLPPPPPSPAGTASATVTNA